jgi:glycosyltransferase involved in cell wall biosynthesis
MKLAVIVSHPIQYYSPWFAHVAAALAERGGALRVFYLWDFGVADRLDPKFGREVTWDVPLLEGHDHEFVPNVSRRPGTSWFGGLDNPKLLSRVRDWRPDAVLQFGYNYKSLVGFDLRWNATRAPLLFRGDSHLLADDGEQSFQSSVVSFQREWLKQWTRKVVLRALFKRFAGFLAVGRANADYFRAHGVPESMITICPHAVDNAFFLGRKNASIQFSAGSVQRGEGRGLRGELGIPEDGLVFLFAGKFEEKKQPLQLLKAFLSAHVGKATLLMVGSGALEAALKTEALKTEGSAKRVLFLPFQNQSRMPAVYRTGDVLVLPSKGRYETWGLAVNEAGCCGLPSIVSSHVGCGPDLVEQDVTGWIFPAGSTSGLARSMETATACRSGLASMGDEMRRRIASGYSYDRATEALLGVLQRLVHDTKS